MQRSATSHQRSIAVTANSSARGREAPLALVAYVAARPVADGLLDEKSGNDPPRILRTSES